MAPARAPDVDAGKAPAADAGKTAAADAGKAPIADAGKMAAADASTVDATKHHDGEGQPAHAATDGGPTAPGDAARGAVAEPSAVRWRDIEPLMTRYCVGCHGDEGKPKARRHLDISVRPFKSHHKNAPGLIAKEVTRRNNGLPEMPLGKLRKVITDAEIARFKQWVADGADYGLAEADDLPWFSSGYAAIRRALALDQLEQARSAASEMVRSLGKPDREPWKPLLTTLAGAKDLAAARDAFGAVSRLALATLAKEPAAAKRLTAYHCPMRKGGYAKWVQVDPRMGNPYMGTKMPGCGTKVPVAP